MQPLPRLIDAWLSACPRNVCPRAKNQCMVHRLPTLHPDSTSSLPGTCQQPETICRWRVWKPETLVDAMLVLLRCDLQYGVRSWLPLRAPYLSLYHILYLYLIYIIYIYLSLSHMCISHIYICISLSLSHVSISYIYMYIYIIYIIYIPPSGIPKHAVPATGVPAGPGDEKSSGCSSSIISVRAFSKDS